MNDAIAVFALITCLLPVVFFLILMGLDYLQVFDWIQQALAGIA